MVGAGGLSCTIWKPGCERGGFRYSFNIFKQDSFSGHVTQQFESRDIKDLVKLANLLAIVLVDDGCVSEKVRDELLELSADLARNRQPRSSATRFMKRRLGSVK